MTDGTQCADSRKRDYLREMFSTPHGILVALIFDAISRAKRALPYPARMLFSRSIVWIGKKVITYCLKTPFIPISANLVVFCRSVTRLKTRAGLAGAGFVRKIASKSHRNRMKNRMCKRCDKIPPSWQKLERGKLSNNIKFTCYQFLSASPEIITNCEVLGFS